MQLGQLSLVVRDYDEAIEFFTKRFGFELIEDTVLSDVKRWVVVGPKGSDCKLLLAKAANEEQASRIGNQTGGRVFLFLYTNTFEADYQFFKSQNIEFARELTQESWGRVAVIKDLYGNLYDLIERNF